MAKQSEATSPENPRVGAATAPVAAPFTLRFTEWRCGHHGTRPADIPVHSIEQAQAIVQAIGYAISQPGHARAAIFDENSGTTVYMTDDYAETIKPGWGPRTIVYHGSEEEIAELRTLQAVFDYAYGGTLTIWDGNSRLDDHTEVVTTLSVEAIEQATAPVEWYHDSDQRHVLCDVPPVLKHAAELLEELREAAAELLAEEGGAA